MLTILVADLNPLPEINQTDSDMHILDVASSHDVQPDDIPGHLGEDFGSEDLISGSDV